MDFLHTMAFTHNAPELIGRFQRLAEAHKEQVTETLDNDLQVEDYYHWLANRYIRDEDWRDPVKTSTQVQDEILYTHYDDPNSLKRLDKTLARCMGVQSIPLFSYYGQNPQQRFKCLLCPVSTSFVRAIGEYDLRGHAGLVQAQCSNGNTSTGIPEFFKPIGELHVAKEKFSMSVPGWGESSYSYAGCETSYVGRKTEFVVGVTPSRKVYFVRNPGSSTVFNKGCGPVRTSPSDALPGFTDGCEAVSLGLSIDQLFAWKQMTLIIRKEDLLKIPSGTHMRFGGVDYDGWKRLDKISEKFAAVAHYPDGKLGIFDATDESECGSDYEPRYGSEYEPVYGLGYEAECK